MTDATTTIRKAGPYTITVQNGRVHCNDAEARLQILTAPIQHPVLGHVIEVVDTGCKGANGKTDIVALGAEHSRAIHDAIKAYNDARAPRASDAEIAAADARERNARAYDLTHNEGGEGYNPYRDGGPAFGPRGDALDR